jgi:hypothetical protein
LNDEGAFSFSAAKSVQLEIKLLQLKSVTAKKQRISDEFNDKTFNHALRLKSMYSRSH